MRKTKLYREIATSVSKDPHYPPNYSNSPENAQILLPEHHVQIASALNRHLRTCRLTGNRMRMILNVFEQTVGWRKIEDDMNGGRLHQLLAVRADHSNQLVRDLYALNIILLKRGDYGFWMSLNYHFDHWGKPQYRAQASNDPRCLLSDYYQNEPEDSGIDLSLACLNNTANHDENTDHPAAPRANKIAPEYAMDILPNPVLIPPNPVTAIPEVVSIPPNLGQQSPNVVNINLSSGGVLLDLTSFGGKNSQNSPNLGATKNKYTKKTTTDSAIFSKNSQQTEKVHVSPSKTKATNKNTKQPDPHDPVQKQTTQEQPDSETLLFFYKEKEQAIIANIEASIETKMQGYERQIEQISHSLSDIVQRLEQQTQQQPNSASNAEVTAASAIECQTYSEQDIAQTEASNSEYQQYLAESAQEAETTAIEYQKYAAQVAAKSEANTPEPQTNSEAVAETNSKPQTSSSRLNYPEELSYAQKRGITDLLSPIKPNDAQMILDILAERLQNGTEPVKNVVGYLARLLQKYHADGLDKSRYVSSEDKARQQQKKQAAIEAGEIRAEYRDAVADHKQMQNNFGYFKKGEGLSAMEYFTSIGLTDFWEGIEQRLYTAQNAMEALQNT